MMTLSAFSMRDSTTVIFVDTLEPPTMATKGFLGFCTAPVGSEERPHIRTSSVPWEPAAEPWLDGAVSRAVRVEPAFVYVVALSLTVKVVQLLLEQEASDGWLEELGHALGGGVGAVGSAEGVVHVQVSVGSQLRDTATHNAIVISRSTVSARHEHVHSGTGRHAMLWGAYLLGEVSVVLLLLLVEAHVLQQDELQARKQARCLLGSVLQALGQAAPASETTTGAHLAILHALDSGLHGWADAVLNQLDLQCIRESRGPVRLQMLRKSHRGPEHSRC